ELANDIASYLKLPLCERDIVTFPNDNIFVKLRASVRGQDCYVIQSTSIPVHRNLMELLIMIQTLRLDSAARITAVVPYLCYARSDKKDQPRVPITARLVADLIEVAGADRYVTLDLHADQIQGFFSIPGDVLTAFYIHIDYLRSIKDRMHSPVVVTADLGFAKKARNYAAALNIPLSFIEKRRMGNDAKAQALTLIGDVYDRDAIIVDDEVDTGGLLALAGKQGEVKGAGHGQTMLCSTVVWLKADDRAGALPGREEHTTGYLPTLPGKTHQDSE
ncbi:MAG: ribose-phosphate diphosphokinase, partial [Rhodocyclaceae bacterium]|nr:ribose-phosphate diphosphokinase [Rhodocyclaceae bacterium]